MKTLLSALLLPETTPSIRDMGSLLLFFDSVSYYHPVESDSENTSEYELFQDLCTGYTPAPLDEDLNRFNRLIRELGNSRSDDLARLFSSAESPIVTGEIKDKAEMTTGSVLAALHKDTDKTAHIQHKERLWQARLVLKLAELLDRREREVRKGLSNIASAEQALLSFLEGDNDGHEENEQSSDLERSAEQTEDYDTYSTGTSSLLVNLKLKAWTELFLTDSSPNRPSILVVSNSSYGSSILDGYENIWGRTPGKILSISIPSITGLGSSGPINEQYFIKRNKLRAAVHGLLDYFGNSLVQAATQGENTGYSLHSEHITAWESAIKTEFPESVPGVRKLDFYCFPGIQPEVLLQRIFHLEPLGPANKQDDTAAGIFAVLRV